MESRDKTQITFHAGLRTIGGTVIEIAYGKARIFFDFGAEFRPEEVLEDESLASLVAHSFAPALDGLYDFRLWPKGEGEAYQETAVFVSHAHLDHTKMLNFLDPSIPVYCSKATASLVQTLNQEGDFLYPNSLEASDYTRSLQGLDLPARVQVGEIQVEMVPVDHDAYGACGLLIRTPDAFIAYTGDLRLHGYQPEASLDYCAQAAGCDVLIMEGVSVSFPEREVDPDQIPIANEEDLIDHFVRLQLENPQRQITFNGYPANVERFAHLVEASPRTVVLEASMANLLLEVFGIQSHFYYNVEGTKPFGSLDPAFEISYADLLADQDTYLWQAVGHFQDLQAGGLYLHSDAQPLGDFDPAYQVFLDELAANHIEFVRLACSGHAIPEDLNRIIDLIQPKLLVPIHSFKPERLLNPYGERILPSRGEKIVL